MLIKGTDLLPEERRCALRRRLSLGDKIRLCEAHSGLSAQISEGAVSANGIRFDGIWVSSLTCSASRGLPDTEIYVLERRLDLIDEILRATARPVVVDGDTGGDATTLEYLVHRLELMGVSALVIEDKRSPKRNSLHGTSTDHLEDPLVFARKIRRAKAAQPAGDLMVFARLESLIAGAGVDDALKRAELYLAYGVDGIMIHSKAKDATEVLDFLKGFQSIRAKMDRPVPLMCVPTTYNRIPAAELFDAGFDVVCHANHLLRAAHKAMSETCVQLLDVDRSEVVDNSIAPVSALFQQSGYYAVLEREAASLRDE